MVGRESRVALIWRSRCPQTRYHRQVESTLVSARHTFKCSGASVTVTFRTPVVLSGNVTVWLAFDAKMKFVGVMVALKSAASNSL